MKYEMEERLIWFKGTLVPIKEAKIMAFSPTAQFGLNVFEGIPCYWNETQKKMYVFRIEDHYERLIKSAKLLQIECEYGHEQLKKALFETVLANEFKESISVRQTLFIDGFGSWGSEGPTSMFVVATPRRFNSSEYKKPGLRVCISSWERISDSNLSPRIKCGANYINSRLGQREAKRNGYDTCIFLNDKGKVSEGPGSCLFIIKRDKLITPLLTDSVLESITRDTVIKLANHLGYEIIERSIDRTELYTADEAFLCGSAMEITPILSVDQFEISNDEGKITSIIHDSYAQSVIGELGPFRKWTTVIE